MERGSRWNLKVGDFEICNTQDVYKIATLRHLNVDHMTRENLFGSYLGNQCHVLIDNTNGTDDDTNGTDRTVGQWRLDVSKNGLKYPLLSGGGAGTGGAIYSNSITSTDAQNDTYGIPLYMLFPALEGRQLPLFLFNDYPVTLEIEFNDANKYVHNMGVANTLSTDNQIFIRDCKLVVDYVLPPAVVLAKYQEQTLAEGGYRFEYPKWSLVKKNLPAVTANKEVQEVEHRLGQENKEVHMIIQMKQFIANKTAATADKLMLDSRIDGVDCEEFNVEVNGEELFRDRVYNTASQYNELSQCLDGPLLIPRPMYFTDPNSLISHQACMESGLVGSYKPLGCDMRNGTGQMNGGGTQVIQGSPLIFKYKRQPHQNIAEVQNDYRPAMDVSYFIMSPGLATVKKLKIGSSVMVRA